MTEPLPRIDQLAWAASEALSRQDWANLRFNAQVMCKEAPDSPLAWSYLGIAFLQLGLEQRSQSLIRRGLECHVTAAQYGPNNSVAVGNLGLAWVKLEQYEKALAVLAPATQRFPDDFDIWGCRAQAELGLSRLDAAGESMHHMLRLLKGNALFGFSLDRLFLGDGQAVPLAQPLYIGTRLIDGEYACEENDFDLHGTGSNFKEALIDLCEYFATLVEEYVYTEDPLDQGAQQLAERLREYLGSDFSARSAEGAR